MHVPNLRGLQAFAFVGRTGSISAAARELGVSSGAISQQIKNLETSLGLTLLERQGRGLTLTYWGQLYYKEIVSGFEQIERAGQIIERAHSHNKITLSALSSVINKWLGRKIFDWQQNHAHINIRLLGHEEEPQLSMSKIDFRLTYGERVKQHTHYRKLFTDWVVPACSPVLLQQRACLVAADILTFPLIHIEWEQDYQQPPQWGDWAEHIGAELGTHVTSALSFALSSSAIDAAVGGRGFVLAQLSLIGDELARGDLIIPHDIRLKLPESYFLAWDSAVLAQPHSQAFYRWLLHIAKEQNQV